MNKKEVKKLTGEDTKDLGIDCRHYPARPGKRKNKLTQALIKEIHGIAEQIAMIADEIAENEYKKEK